MIDYISVILQCAWIHYVSLYVGPHAQWKFNIHGTVFFVASLIHVLADGKVESTCIMAQIMQNCISSAIWGSHWCAIMIRGLNPLNLTPSGEYPTKTKTLNRTRQTKNVNESPVKNRYCKVNWWWHIQFDTLNGQSNIWYILIAMNIYNRINW